VSALLGTSPVGHYVANCQAPDVGNMELLHAHGSPALQQRWLGPLARGEIRSCFSMTEPEHAGSNPVWMGTRAVRDGDDYVITGRKWFTSSADGAAFAIVMAVTDPDAPMHRRASQIVVPMDTPGVRLVRNISVMGHEGSDWASHAEMAYEHVRVPVTNRIGGEGEGFALAQERLGPGRIHHCMRWIGICERAVRPDVPPRGVARAAPGRPLGPRDTVQAWDRPRAAPEIDAGALYVDGRGAAHRRRRRAGRARRDQRDQVPRRRRAAARARPRHPGARRARHHRRHAARLWYRHERGAHLRRGPTRCTRRAGRGASCGATGLEVRD
jgi:alkylation response protein AidB-like acyl-CoA dehydrogenase